ncbi:hypothetical protein [Corynebacterium pseudogenitalium]
MEKPELLRWDGVARLALLTSAKGEVDPLVLEILGPEENEGS